MSYWGDVLGLRSRSQQVHSWSRSQDGSDSDILPDPLSYMQRLLAFPIFSFQKALFSVECLLGLLRMTCPPWGIYVLMGVRGTSSNHHLRKAMVFKVIIRQWSQCSPSASLSHCFIAVLKLQSRPGTQQPSDVWLHLEFLILLLGGGTENPEF